MVMAEFKWSPEAIEAARRVIFSGSLVDVEAALTASVKVQPVVALPPCPTCKGKCRVRLTGAVARMAEICREDPTLECPSCNGSGVDRLIPVSEIRTWIENRGRRVRVGIGAAVYDLAVLSHWLDERKARHED